MTPQEIKLLIESGIEGAEAIVEGDDGTHFESIVISDEFEGLSLVKKHQLVYKTLGDKMKAEIHALSIRPLTRAEWEENKRNNSGLNVL